MQQDALSTADDRQPYHRVNGKIITQSEWRERLRDAVDLFEAFKRQAHKDHEL